jgi:hypothetical protein
VVVRRLWWITLAALGTCLLFGAAVWAAEHWSYRLQGFRPDVALRARRIRGFDLPESGGISAALLIVVVLAPWLARLPERFRAERLALELLGAGLVVAALALAAIVLITYGRSPF